MAGAFENFGSMPDGYSWGDAPPQAVPALDRTHFADALADPATKRALLANVHAEVGDQFQRNPAVAQAKLETILNRASSRGMTPLQAATDPKYYPAVTLQRMQRYSDSHLEPYSKIYADVAAGSNVANYATGNASGTVGFAGGPQTYQAPGTYERFGIEGPDRKWVTAMRSGAPQPAQQPPTPQQGAKVADSSEDGSGLGNWLGKPLQWLSQPMIADARSRAAGADGSLQGAGDDAAAFTRAKLAKYPQLAALDGASGMMDVYNLQRDLAGGALKQRPITWGDALGAGLQIAGAGLTAAKGNSAAALEMAKTPGARYASDADLINKLSMQSALQNAQQLGANADALLKQQQARLEQKRDANAKARFEGLPEPFPEANQSASSAASTRAPVPAVGASSVAPAVVPTIPTIAAMPGVAVTPTQPQSQAPPQGSPQAVAPVDRTQATYKTPAQEAGARARYYGAMGDKTMAEYWKAKEDQATNAERKAAETGAEATVKAGHEKFQSLQDASSQAAETSANADLFEAAMAKMPTGPAAQRALPVAKLLSDLGIGSGIMRSLGYKGDEQVTAAQLMSSLSSRATLSSAQAMKGSLSDKDIAFLSTIGVSLGNTPGANKALLDYTRANADLAMKLGEASRAYKKQRGTLDDGWHDVAAQIYANHPLKQMVAKYAEQGLGKSASAESVNPSAIEEGAVARNPKTGEQLIMQGGKWVTHTPTETQTATPSEPNSPAAIAQARRAAAQEQQAKAAAASTAAQQSRAAQASAAFEADAKAMDPIALAQKYDAQRSSLTPQQIMRLNAMIDQAMKGAANGR